MYKCNDCGHISGTVIPIYNRQYELTYRCEHCRSEDITDIFDVCGICGQPLVAGDRAYQTDEMMICTDCIRQVVI